MKLTKKEKEMLVKEYNRPEDQKKGIAYVKLFNPTGTGTWYLTELNPETNVAFGLAGIQEWELGYIDLNELAAFKGQFGLGIEKDRWFCCTPLEAIQDEIYGLDKKRRNEVREKILMEAQQ